MNTEQCQKFTYSEKESTKFGLNVFRGEINKIHPQSLKETLESEGMDLAIIRIPIELSKELYRLNKIGLDYIIADVLVYYSMDLNDYIPKKLLNRNLVFCPYKSITYRSIDALIDQIFRNYSNHYTSNPYISVNITEAYKEWAQSLIKDYNKSTNTWIIKRGEKDIAFILCSSKMRETEVILNGVIPSESGKKVYSDIIRYIQAYFKKQSFKTIKISTQLSNYAVQKVWARNGFVLDQAYYTIHINANIKNKL